MSPVWFISHGAPDLVLRDEPATRFMKDLSLAPVTGLVVISAHWFSRELEINSAHNPALMYDFHGFPDTLYRVRWPASSPAWLQQAVQETLQQGGLAAKPTQRELDHEIGRAHV